MKFEKVWNITKEIISSDTFNYWFSIDANHIVKVYPVDIEYKSVGSESIGMFNYDNINEYKDILNINIFPAEIVGPIIMDFQNFIEGRPDGALIPMLDYTCGESISPTIRYDTLLNSCVYCNFDFGLVAKFADNRRYNAANKVMNWLHSTDFFIAPASTQYHESYSGGLFVHTKHVIDNVYQLIKTPIYNNVDIPAAITCAIVHDWCKINLYESFNKNVKNDAGDWIQVEGFKHKEPTIPLGHGETSLWMAGKFFNLSLEQACAIRWHQGRWHVCDDEKNDLQAANERYPMVHLLQFADQLAITNYANN